MCPRGGIKFAADTANVARASRSAAQGGGAVSSFTISPAFPWKRNA